MKQFRAIAAVLVLAVGISGCGTETEAPGMEMTETQAQTSGEVQAEITEIPDTTGMTEALSEIEESTKAAEIPPETEADEEVLLDENGEPLFTPEDALDAALRDKICRLLEAAAAHDEAAYFEEFDTETFITASEGITDAEALANSAAQMQKRLQSRFQALSEAFKGSFSGHLTDIAMGEWENSVPGTEIYGMRFYTETDGGRILIDGTAYLRDGVWSVELDLMSVIDNTYYEYEPLILAELLAAAQGDKDKYLDCVDSDMLAEVMLVLLLEGEEYPAEELASAKKEMREIAEDTCNDSFEDLSGVLGKDFDGKIRQVQYFGRTEDAVIPDGELYGRILVAVLNSQNEYQEVEGYAYSIGGKKGVWLQPD